MDHFRFFWDQNQEYSAGPTWFIWLSMKWVNIVLGERVIFRNWLILWSKNVELSELVFKLKIQIFWECFFSLSGGKRDNEVFYYCYFLFLSRKISNGSVINWRSLIKRISMIIEGGSEISIEFMTQLSK